MFMKKVYHKYSILPSVFITKKAETDLTDFRFSIYLTSFKVGEVSMPKGFRVYS